MTIKIMIADDHGILRAGLIALLRGDADLEVVGEADTAEGAVKLALAKKPDLALMDISMPDMGGIQATREIHLKEPSVRVMILTVHEDRELMEDAIHAGACGYILKSAIKDELFGAIRTVMRGDLYLHPSMTRLLFKQDLKPVEKEVECEQLTSREIEVLRLIAAGYTNRQIADLLHLSVRTVEYHRGNLTGKLNLHSRVELARYAEDQGIL